MDDIEPSLADDFVLCLTEERGGAPADVVECAVRFRGPDLDRDCVGEELIAFLRVEQILVQALVVGRDCCVFAK